MCETEKAFSCSVWLFTEDEKLVEEGQKFELQNIFHIRERQLDSMGPLGNVIDIENNPILFYDIAVMMSLHLLCGQILVYSHNSEYKSCRKQVVEKQHSLFSFTFSLVGTVFHS